MKKLARRLAIITTGTMLSIGLMGASPAEAAKDSSWGRQGTSLVPDISFTAGKKDSSWG